ncbi:hypothetical protein BH24CHL1_BH24CHL1_14720 [soil metagenome]
MRSSRLHPTLATLTRVSYPTIRTVSPCTSPQATGYQLPKPNDDLIASTLTRSQ